MSLQNVTKVYIAVGSLFVFSICVLNAFYVLNYIKRKFESTNSLEDAVNDQVGLFFFCGGTSSRTSNGLYRGGEKYL